jgi:hypothetical protein
MSWIWGPALIGVPGALLIVSGLVHLYAGRVWRGGRGIFTGGLFMVLAAGAALFALGLQNYWSMSYETPLVEISVAARDLAQKRYVVVIRHLDGSQPSQACDLQGDEWVIATYTLDQVANKYLSAVEANGKPITACDLAASGPVSPYVPQRWLTTLTSWSQVEDRRFGSANYMPLADGAVYTLLMTQSGLNAEPANEAARTANQSRG